MSEWSILKEKQYEERLVNWSAPIRFLACRWGFGTIRAMSVIATPIGTDIRVYGGTAIGPWKPKRVE